MNEQVLSIEQMQYLIELGVDTNKASMAWCKTEGDKGYHLLLPNSQRVFEYNLVVKYIPTFTLQDMLDIMPREIDTSNELRIDLYDNSFSYWWIGGFCDNKSVVSFTAERLIISAYKMLCWLAENGYLNKK